ncbi:MAG TPA: BadF/BadG/BcrA/BcrD ATPase family protein [Acidobacteriaceae bacterium]|jgi:N-acetylglucosamine kinase-like BadF-type ATPase|nr:BadF/BadG/BcrA/BcrD ATPase family protein [Acidobacteriaceae bacterium]
MGVDCVQYFLGVDAGGTKTEFVLGDESRELGRVRTRTIKRMKADADTAEANLRTALQELQRATGISPQAITRCCIGTAGETVPMVVNWLREAFARHVGGELIIVGDVEIALDSAFSGGRGVLVLAGTGSNVAGRATTGRIVTAGGWGPALADQGSGHFLGLEALRRGFLAMDQQRPTRVLDDARAFWNLGSLSALIEFANANPAPEFSRLAPLVVKAAEQGDAVAQQVVAQGGTDLAALAGLVIERIRAMEADSAFEVPSVAIAGSILEQAAAVRDAMIAELRRRYPAIRVVDQPADPPAGALWAARQDVRRATAAHG